MKVKALVGFALVLVGSAVGMGCKGGATCAEGATKHAGTGICAKLPAGFTFEKDAQKLGDHLTLSARNSSFHGPTIFQEKKENLEMRMKASGGMAGGDLVLKSSGDCAPSKGKWWLYHNNKGNYDFGTSLIEGKSNLYRCEIQNEDPTKSAEMMTICASLGGP